MEPKQIMPCPARGKYHPELLEDANYAAETKEDGDRRIGQFLDKNGIPFIYYTGRRISDVTGKLVEKGDNVPHITQGLILDPWEADSALLHRMSKLSGTTLDGECVLPAEFIPPDNGGKSKFVTKVMGSKPEKALALQKYGTVINGKMRWSVFDILSYKHKDVSSKPLSERRKLLLEVLDYLDNRYVVPTLHVVENKKGFLDSILGSGGEGIVLKRLDRPYGDHLSWVKKKGEISADVVVMDFEEPEHFSTKVSGENTETKFWKNGWIGAIKFGQFQDGVLKYCGKCSGMDDDLREKISKSKDSYIGLVMKIQANGREPTGAFRHPRFEMWRNDKNPKDCVWDLNES